MAKNKKNISGAGMVDVGDKASTRRTAIASAEIYLGKKAFQLLMSKGSPKGNVLEAAKIAGVMAAKNTPQIIPLCHPLELTKASVNFTVNKKFFSITISAEVHYTGKTGVEMEALTAVSVAALTIYDMMKWADKGMAIKNVRLLSKTGGKSGDFKAK